MPRIVVNVDDVANVTMPTQGDFFGDCFVIF